MSSNLSSVAYEHIQQLLVNDALPGGAKLSEQALARQLGISRTPVREAIRQLREKGVLYQVPSSGTFVVRPDRSQIVEVCEVRQAIECMTITKAARRMSPQDMDELQRCCDRMHEAVTAFRDSGDPLLDGDLLRQFLTADFAFHLLLLRVAGNRTALTIVTDGQMRNRIFGYRSHRRDLHHLAWVWLIHSRIVRAVRRRDGRAARYWLKRHIRDSMRDALATFDRQQARQVPGPESPPDLDQIVVELIRKG